MNALQISNFSFSYPPASSSENLAGNSANHSAVGPSKNSANHSAVASVNNSADSFPAEKLLSGVSLKLKEASFALLVGATGSGKTTLLRSVKPELAPVGNKGGTIEVFDRVTSDLSLQDSASLIGYVSQNPENQIICDSVWHEIAFGLENLGIAEDEMRRRVAEIAYFFGIESWIHTKTASLSGGQKQLLTLASILVMQPKLLLLDEPTAQLDPIAEKNFLHALFRINRELGITVMVATHSPEAMASYATEAYRIEAGQLSSVDLEEFNFSEVGIAAQPGKQEAACSFVSSETSIGEEGSVINASFKVNTPDQPPTIVLRDLYFRYTKTAPWVLRAFDLRIAGGIIHAIVGGNGSGKSSLLQSIAKTLKPERGSVKNKHCHSQVFLPQDPKTLFVCDSVEEELAEWQRGCGYNDAAISDALERLGLVKQRQKHPYDLSGGEQQKLALAKLLLTQPSLVLLDEPTKGLDPKAKCEIAETLAGLRKSGVTIVLASHDLAFISQLADKITMLFDGEASCTELASSFFLRNMFYRPKPDGFLRLWKEAKH